jgi:hypothetical protein
MHLFWASHEEKHVCVRLSMGGQPWSELEFHGPAMGSSPERGKRGKEEGEGGGQLGCSWGAMGSC